MSAQPENSIHDEAFLLLPWYVNGTLEDSQKMLIEAHVRSCIVCRRELPSEYRTLDVFRNESPVDQSMQAGFERLHSRIAARIPSRLPSRSPSRYQSQASRPASTWWSFITDLLRPFPAGGIRLATVSLAILAVGFGLAFLSQQQPGEGAALRDTAAVSDGYHTLSSPVAGTAVANQDDVHVIFSPYASPATIEGVLKAIPAKIVAGPDNTAIYTVRLQSVSDSTQRHAAIIRLRNQPHVIFAEAAQPLSLSRSVSSSVSSEKAQSQ